MGHRSYRPRGGNITLPHTVEAQRKLVESTTGRSRSLVVLFLSTGMHPAVLATPAAFSCAWDRDYVTWKRPKTLRPVTMAWSRAMKEGTALEDITALKGTTRQYLHSLVFTAGEEVHIRDANPRALRHDYFVNRARLGHNPFDIAHSSGTDLQTIYSFYTIGMNDGRRLADSELTWLKYLMEA